MIGAAAYAQEPIQDFGLGRLYYAKSTRDGKQVLSWSRREAVLWDGETGRQRWRMRGHTAGNIGADFPANGQWVATGAEDQTVRLWDTATGQLIKTIQTTGTLYGIRVTADGSRLITEGDRIRIWDVQTGLLRQTILSNEIVGDVSVDGTKIIYFDRYGPANFGIWDVPTSQTIKTFSGDSFVSTQFSPDETMILTGHGVYGSNQYVRMWNANTGQTSRTLTLGGQGYDPPAMDWSPDSSRVVAAAENGQEAVIWDPRTGYEVDHVPIVRFGENKQVAYTNDVSARVLQRSANFLRLAQFGPFPTNVTLAGYCGTVTSLAFTPDGTGFLAGSDDKSALLWDIHDNAVKRIFSGQISAVTAVDITHDGNKCLTAGLDKTLRVFDAASGAMLNTLSGHGGTIHCAAFTPDGSRVLTGGDDRSLRVWDLATHQAVFTFTDETTAVMSLAIAPDGKTALAGGWDGVLRIYDLQAGQLSKTITGFSYAIASLAISPDGTKAIVGGCDVTTHTARLIEIQTGRTLANFTGHGDDLIAVAFSPNGRRVLTASYDGTVRLWDAVVERLVLTLTGFGGQVRALGFSPDGARALTAGDDGIVRLWDVSKNGVSLWERYD